jgi:hypothetical protein
VATFAPNSSIASEGFLHFDAAAGWSNIADLSGRPRRIPTSIPRSQMYYWTLVWQREVQDSRAALDAGDFRDFDNASDLTRWLLSEEN